MAHFTLSMATECDRSRPSFRLVVESPEYLIALLDENGRVVHTNQTLAEYFGSPPAAIIGRTIADLFPEPAAGEYYGHIAEVVSSQHARYIEVPVPFPARPSWVEALLLPEVDAHGAVGGVLIVARDVTSRREVEDGHTRLLRAVEQAAESVVITDATGLITHLNPSFERTSGYTRAEILGRHVRILKSGVHDQLFYEDLWRTLKGGDPWHGVFVNRRKDGVFYQEEATISPVRDDSGRVTHYVAVKRDVTRERALESQLQQVEQFEAIGRLAGGVAHDFNNIIGVIQGYTELLQQSVAPEDPRRSDIDEIGAAAARAASLTQQLLAYSRRQVLQPKPLRLDDVLRQNAAVLGRVLGEDVTIEVDSDGQSAFIYMDPTQLDRVLMNLAVNARDAMPAGGVLSFETRNVDTLQEPRATLPPGPYVMLAVTDTGCGMNPTTLEHAFEPFFTTKPSGKGTGLGLSTVHGIVKQSGGHIEVTSQPSVGTSFHIWLPRYEDLHKPAELEPPQEEVGLAGRETVLLAEDDHSVRTLTSRVLRNLGYTVLVASNGAEAVSLAASYEQSIDLLLTDVIMPDLNGRALADRLCRHRPRMRVLYISGYTDDIIGHHGVLKPGIHFLAKPFSGSVLARAVRQALDSTSWRPLGTDHWPSTTSGARIAAIDYGDGAQGCCSGALSAEARDRARPLT
jgi:PAS domain S-box-containing protein